MRKLSRSTLAALAAVVAIPATIGIAKTVEHARWHNMSPETRARLDDGHLAMAKAALRLTPDQEKLWSPIEAQVRDAFKDRAAKHAEREKTREQFEKDRADGKRPDLGERVEKMSQTMTERAERMKAFAGAFKPFYATLSDEQKDVLRPLIHEFAPGFGPGGHHGHRWAFGGWGPQGGDGGWGGRHHGKHGGPMNDGDDREDGRGAQPDGKDAKPPEKL